MFYRRKLLLAILEVFGGKLEKRQLQKLLFLICNKQQKPEYDFIPYLYGCYSHSAKADLNVMVTKGMLLENEISYTKTGQVQYFSTLKDNDKKTVQQAFLLHGNKKEDVLIKYTYLNFPYYAINSTIADTLLNNDELANIAACKPFSSKTILYTIGYEGISLEAYLNKLIRHDIKVLVDVRNNPLSQKFGFSKSQLQRYCDGLKIKYIHVPEVGIQSEYRQQLHNQSDYDKLFELYKTKSLPFTGQSQNKIFDLLKENKRIALTCFEANICQCHRKHLAEAITRLPNWEYELKHI